MDKTGKKLTGLVLIAMVCGLTGFVYADSKAIGLEEAIRMVPGDMQAPSRYALVIGVGEYEDSRIPELSACRNDARQLNGVLTDPGSGMFPSGNVTLLLDKDVTRKRVVDALDMLGRKAGKEDLVVIFFSGHGAVDERGRSYWVMHDSAIDRLRATALAETEITELLGEIRTSRLVTLIDACYSASTAKLGKSKSLLDLRKLYPKFTGDGRVAITASKGDQLSVVISDKRHPGYGYSAFSWNIITGLKGKGDVDSDGVVTVNELWSYVKDRTEATARQQGGNQQPQLKGQIGSKFLLTVDSKRLIEKSQQIQQGMATLKKLVMEDKITVGRYKEGEQLVKTDPAGLSETDRQKRQVYLDLAEGRLTARYLQAALDAIETPEQRAARLEREANERAGRIRQGRIKELLSIARANDNKTDGKKALDALDGVLELDPSNSQALALRKKISGYYVPSAGEMITNSIGMKLVYIPAGEFLMGSPSSEKDWDSDEGPQHQVRISKGFYMGVTEVTQAQYKAVTGNNPSHFKGDSNPVEQVSWNDAKEFCKKLSRKEDQTYRLPTEAEWEYACRAGTNTSFGFGDNESSLSSYGWYGYEKSGKKTHPVGQKNPNTFGLYDMHGNVWEWCSDWYSSDYYKSSPSVNPVGPTSGSYRVLRGGSWNNNPGYCRSANRTWFSPDGTNDDIGFRLCVSSVVLD